MAGMILCSFHIDTKKPGIIIEFKKVSRVLKETLDSASDMALQQIHDKKYAQELNVRGIRTSIAYGIAFEGKKIAIKEQRT